MRYKEWELFWLKKGQLKHRMDKLRKMISRPQTPIKKFQLNFELAGCHIAWAMIYVKEISFIRAKYGNNQL